MIVAILGRQPALGMAELERVYGGDECRWFSDVSALVDSTSVDIERLGGIQKAGRVVIEIPTGDWRRVSLKIVQTYALDWARLDGKITLGISAYGFDTDVRDIQKTAILLKQKLKKSGVSLRVIPNSEPALNTAVSHHNKLGLSANKVELIVVRARSGRIIVAESTGAQNITALARRDQGRPKRDAFVGMLPPKLALMMVNMGVGELVDGRWYMVDGNSSQQPSAAAVHTSAAVGVSSRSASVITDTLDPKSELAPGPREDVAGSSISDGSGRKGEQESDDTTKRILDPFCGTGVILQEAALLGYSVYGTDLADKMIDYSQTNLAWLAESHHLTIDSTLAAGDAMTTTWQPPISAVVCESYLGQPFSAPPSPAKLADVRKTCNHIISTFLQNIGQQITPGTPLCVAVPAWKDINGDFTHLPLIRELDALGYTRHQFKNVKDTDLLYYRADQVVARELLVLVKK